MNPELSDIVIALQAFIANPSSHPACIDPDGMANIWRFMALYYPTRLQDGVIDLTKLNLGNTYWHNVRSYQLDDPSSAIDFSLSEFHGSVFDNADLKRTRFSRARMTDITVHDSRLEQCNFHDVRFKGQVILRDNALTDIDATGCTLHADTKKTEPARDLTMVGCSCTRVNLDNFQAPNTLDEPSASVYIIGCYGQISMNHASAQEIKLAGGDYAYTHLTLDVKDAEVNRFETFSQGHLIQTLNLNIDGTQCDNFYLHGQASLYLSTQGCITDWFELSVTEASYINVDGIIAYDTVSVVGAFSLFSARHASIYHLLLQSDADIKRIDLLGLQSTSRRHLSDMIQITASNTIKTMNFDDTGDRLATRISAKTIHHISFKNSQLSNIVCSANRMHTVNLIDTNNLQTLTLKPKDHQRLLMNDLSIMHCNIGGKDQSFTSLLMNADVAHLSISDTQIRGSRDANFPLFKKSILRGYITHSELQGFSSEKGLLALTNLQNTTITSPRMVDTKPLCGPKHRQAPCDFFTQRGATVIYAPYYSSDTAPTPYEPYVCNDVALPTACNTTSVTALSSSSSSTSRMRPSTASAMVGIVGVSWLAVGISIVIAAAVLLCLYAYQRYQQRKQTDIIVTSAPALPLRKEEPILQHVDPRVPPPEQTSGTTATSADVGLSFSH